MTRLAHIKAKDQSILDSALAHLGCTKSWCLDCFLFIWLASQAKP